MLNDESRRPEDLPETDETTTLPYAAGLAPDAPPGPAGAGSRRSGRGRAMVAAVVVVVVVVALALVAAVGLLAGRATRPAPPAAAPGTIPVTAPVTTTGPGATATGGATSPQGVGADPPARLAAFYTQPVHWQACPGSRVHQCASIEVPVDYAEPDGDTFELALRKVPALTPEKRVGTLVINPGGPGGSGLEYAQFSSFVFSKQLRESYDILGFDPRGIGQSDAVACLSDDDMDLLFENDPTPDDAAERDKLLRDTEAVTERCARNGGERALHMSTTEVARDMDVMRALVGSDRLNYVGVSYGTVLGALYADLFPERVGRFVLDSAVSPNQTDEQQLGHDIQGFETSIDAFIEWCVDRDDCALGTDADGARDRIADLLDEVERRPLETSRGDIDSIGEGWLGFAIFMCLYSEQSWPILDKGLAEAFAGKGDVLLSYAMNIVGRSASGDYDESSYLHAMIPVRCADWPRSDNASLAAAHRKALLEHPLWSRLAGLLHDPCGAWPGEPRQPSGGTLGQGAAPVLVIGNLRDPATPIGGTKQLAEDLASAILVTSDHDGHGTYYAGNSCVDSIVDGYLIKGTVPSSDQAC
ncbi:alpha/beta hydrolase [Intrasporangium calvum]|uniref:alpha/beta hydrolase n=1 Tax=Intrasporangium calvum TaxID=53358 RepID=UPI000DF5FA04|nr:alpha/beta hydrolase [Intrasporangium calvum]AXG12379.1 alpha/beta hydrolase [Intrasporangium calvum]